METEHSLLEEISRKESQLKEQSDVVCREAEIRLHDARTRAREIIGSAEKTGAEEADAYMQKGLAALNEELLQLKAAGAKDAAALLEKGTANMEKAASRITAIVQKV